MLDKKCILGGARFLSRWRLLADPPQMLDKRVLSQFKYKLDRLVEDRTFVSFSL